MVLHRQDQAILVASFGGEWDVLARELDTDYWVNQDGGHWHTSDSIPWRCRDLT